MDETWSNKGHRRNNMWLMKADSKFIKTAGLSHRKKDAFVGGMHLPDSEGQRLIIVAFSKNF